MFKSFIIISPSTRKKQNELLACEKVEGINSYLDLFHLKTFLYDEAISRIRLNYSFRIQFLPRFKLHRCIFALLKKFNIKLNTSTTSTTSITSNLPQRKRFDT